MVLAVGALFSKLTTAVVHRALEACSVSTVKSWIKENLGVTVQAQRRLLYQPGGETKMG